MNNTNKLMSFSSSVLLVGASILALASPAFAGYGSSPGGGNGNPVCNNSAPGKPRFVFVRKSGASQIELGWNSVDSASSWTIAYGNQPGKYIWGMSDFGDNSSRSVKINMLPPGVYYAVIKANNGCMPGPFSDERKVTVFNNGNVLGAHTTHTSGQVLGARITPTEIPTNTPTVTSFNPTPTSGSSDNGGTDNLNIFQRIWHFITGR